MKSSLANAMVLQEMFRHSDLIKMAGHTMGTASIEYNDTESALNTTGLLFKFYRDHFGSVPVAGWRRRSLLRLVRRLSLTCTGPSHRLPYLGKRRSIQVRCRQNRAGFEYRRGTRVRNTQTEMNIE